MWDALDDAIYQTVHSYQHNGKDGAVALAPMVNMNAGTLSNKANPNMESYIFGLKESVPVQHITGDYRIARAYCAELGGAFFPFGMLAGASDEALLDLWTKLMVEEGETASVIQTILSRGECDGQLLKDLTREIHEDISVKLALLKRVGEVYVRKVKAEL